MFFECLPIEGQKSNITPHFAKRTMLMRNKEFIQAEQQMFALLESSLLIDTH